MKKVDLSNRKVVFISAPLRGENIGKNIERTRTYARWCYDCGNIPYAPNLYFPQFLSAGNEEHDAFAETINLEALKDCDEIWVFDKDGVSTGMEAEIRVARNKGVRIRYYSKKEIPPRPAAHSPIRSMKARARSASAR